MLLNKANNFCKPGSDWICLFAYGNLRKISLEDIANLLQTDFSLYNNVVPFLEM
jgi:hypothetical protein